MEVVNTELTVYSKAGEVLLGPEATNTLWHGFGGLCETTNQGDATVLFDSVARRWIIQQFAFKSGSSGPYFDCIAVSTSSDATGSWHRYSYEFSNFPDYPKAGVWPDAYYVSFNMFTPSEEYVGPRVCAFNRMAMLEGQSANRQCFSVSSNEGTLLPATLDGTRQPPAGEPEWLVTLSGTQANALAYWKFHVDWSNTANSTLTGPVNLPVAGFSEACGGGTCIPQAETSQRLDSLADRLMYRLAYRNLGSREAMVVTHAVSAGGSVGMRWYELRPSGGALTVYQQGTYAPDGAYRWMGSIAMDMSGDMGLGYSVSSASLHPQIRYTGRRVGDPLGTMPQGETTLYAGGGSQIGREPESGSRWGDYTEMSVDPSDECTFWYVNEYLPNNGQYNWHTRIGSFRFPSCDKSPPSVVSDPASSITRSAATSNGQVYPNGTPTIYWFEYGRAGGFEARTPTSEAGSSESWIPVSAAIGGLSSCTTYQFRLVVENTDSSGPVYGGTETFSTDCRPPSVAAEPTTRITRIAATLEGQVYPNGVATTYWYEYGKAGSFESKTAPTAVGSDETWHWESNNVSLTPCTEYQTRLVAENEDSKKTSPGGVVVGPTETIKTQCWPPEVRNESTGERKRSKMELKAEVYPHGLETKYWFEYGKVGGANGGWERATAIEVAGNDAAWHSEHATAGLEPCHEYQYRVVAENEDSKNPGSKDAGGVVNGVTQYFETRCRPLIQNVKVSHLEPGSVVFEAEVNPEEAETRYHFEYDTREYKQGEAAHGTSVPLPEPSAGSGVAFVKENAAVVKLMQGRTYYFNFVSHNESGQTTKESSVKTPMDWELSNSIVTTKSGVKAEGSVVLTGSAGTVECTVKAEGSVESSGRSEFTKMTGAAGEVAIPCRVLKNGCGAVEVEAVHLPWHTELVNEPVKNSKGEVERYEMRDRFYGAAGSEPGWLVKCNKDTGFECVGEPSGNAENIAGGVAIEFDAKSGSYGCLRGHAQEGVMVLNGAAGSTLSAYGAPAGPQRPMVVTREASSVGGTSATLNGTVGAKGVATTYQFEYGTTTGYGAKIPVSPVSAGEGRTRVEVSQALSGLESSTLYHYRVVASNSAGTSYGEDKTFTTGYPSAWLVNGVKKLAEVKGEGTLVLAGPGTYECQVVETGLVLGLSEGRAGTIEKVTGPKGETAIPCHVVKEGCKTYEVEATHLPWKMELVDEPVKNSTGEVERYEVRDRFYGAAGSEPGWTVKCNGTSSFECVGEPSGNVENVSSGVPVEFDGKSAAYGCLSGHYQEGAIVLRAVAEGATLSAYGAPAGPQRPMVVTREASSVGGTSATLNGTVGAKGVATTYQFEYGTTTGYGAKIPVSPVSAGEGRTRVEVSQALSGLESSTLYHYRVVASNSAGTSYGEDKTVATRYPSQWQVNGKEPGALNGLIKTEGTLTLRDTGLEVIEECTITETGRVSKREGSIYEITGTKGETTFVCHATQSGWCGTATIETSATNLLWSTELVDVPIENSKHETHYETRLRYYGTAQPGFTIKCAFMGSTVTDNCLGEPSGHVENGPSDVLVDIQAKSSTLACTGSAIGTGTIEGTVTVKSTETGATLSVYGAPGP